MCGIYGVASFDPPLDGPNPLDRMGDTLRHRGPDGCAAFEDEHVALGVRHLRIIDPGSVNTQPFVDQPSGVVLICNGEIYNADALRTRYSSYRYHSQSDVEPLVPLYLDRGPGGIAEIDGMFAIVIWDPRDRRLVLARDRAGEKPLHYMSAGDRFYFASEIQPLLAVMDQSRSLDRKAASDLLTFGYVLEPRTMFAGIRRVAAGSVMIANQRHVSSHAYWTPERLVRSPVENPSPLRLYQLLATAVEKQTRADVPVGVFLSGGVDSSLLAALAVEARGASHVRTFTIGFDNRSFDERAPAAMVAGFLGTEHVAVVADGEILARTMHEVITSIAEPITDPAVLPTVLLAKAAKRVVGVVLSGEGADELFGGYPTYLGHRVAPWLNRLPASIAHRLRTATAAMADRPTNMPLRYLLKRLAAQAHRPPLERHLAWFGSGLHDVLADPAALAERSEWYNGPSDLLSRLMLFDYLTYLRDGLLVKIDRATMLASLEARAPYLDREITAFALGIPLLEKIRGLTSKRILKRAATPHLPSRIVHRRKRGVSVPIAGLLDHQLRPDVDRLLTPDRLDGMGLLHSAQVCELLAQYRSGRSDHARAIWTLLVFALWRERWLGE